MKNNISYVVWEEPKGYFQDGSCSSYSSCGHVIRRDWKYCPYCGKRVKTKQKDEVMFI